MNLKTLVFVCLILGVKHFIHVSLTLTVFNIVSFAFQKNVFQNLIATCNYQFHMYMHIDILETYSRKSKFEYGYM